MNGIWGEIITFILGCGNGHLEKFRDPRFRSFFKHFEQEYKGCDRNVSGSDPLLPLIIYD